MFSEREIDFSEGQKIITVGNEDQQGSVDVDTLIEFAMFIQFTVTIYGKSLQTPPSIKEQQKLLP